MPFEPRPGEKPWGKGSLEVSGSHESIRGDDKAGGGRKRCDGGGSTEICSSPAELEA